MQSTSEQLINIAPRIVSRSIGHLSKDEASCDVTQPDSVNLQLSILPPL